MRNLIIWTEKWISLWQLVPVLFRILPSIIYSTTIYDIYCELRPTRLYSHHKRHSSFKSRSATRTAFRPTSNGKKTGTATVNTREILRCSWRSVSCLTGWNVATVANGGSTRSPKEISPQMSWNPGPAGVIENLKRLGQTAAYNILV